MKEGCPECGSKYQQFFKCPICGYDSRKHKINLSSFPIIKKPDIDDKLTDLEEEILEENSRHFVGEDDD
jgi:predicted  nucleic acid-binding Zn-ribbon protein